ncbi:MAG: indolepyruvate oxidoreductase [Spirochaetaceae bacterium]|nr:MAG: indolepyruvate oxidoreductase [Spirochaetaceae bacterium]
MTCNIVLAGVGGQGVLSLAAIIAHAAVSADLTVKQSEVHGMSQRGGSVVAHLRIADGPIHADVVAPATADLILATEAVEGLRQIGYLSDGGALVAAETFVATPEGYPDHAAVAAEVERHGGVLVDGERIAKECGNARAANTVLLGYASRLLPIAPQMIEQQIAELFASKVRKTSTRSIADINVDAFRAGRAIVDGGAHA